MLFQTITERKPIVAQLIQLDQVRHLVRVKHDQADVSCNFAGERDEFVQGDCAWRDSAALSVSKAFAKLAMVADYVAKRN